MTGQSTPSRRVRLLYRPAVEAPRALSGQCGVCSCGVRCLVGSKTFDQFDDFETLAGLKFKEGFQQSQAFNRFARWSSESFLQLCNKCGILHLSPSMRNRNGISRQT